MLVLGIDPGSRVTGWALLKGEGNKVSYVCSGVLRFNGKVDFLERLTEIKQRVSELVAEISPTEIALESLIYVKSPTALIKLAQTRGVILSELVINYHGKIYEYSPNLVKSSAVGHGHADKESVRKVLDIYLGRKDYATHDESDAVAIALCHILNKNNSRVKKPAKAGRKGLSASLAHKLREI